MKEFELQLPTSHLEYCDPAELQIEVELTAKNRESKYLDDCAVLRADIAGLFIKHQAADADGGWAIFHVDEYAEDGSVLGTLQSRNEVMIFLRKGLGVSGKQLPVLDIRILTNEHIHSETGAAYMCVDFTLDHDNDSQYFVDAFNQTPAGIDLTNTEAAIFGISENGEVFAGNVKAFTPVGFLKRHGGLLPEEPIIPFGHYDYIEDKIHALSVGRELVDTLINLEPIRTKDCSASEE